METIKEDEELVVNNEKPSENIESDPDDIEMSYSVDQEEIYLDKYQKSRAARKQKKLALKKIENKEKMKRTRNERVACPVKNCKWTGPYDLLLQMHTEKCHSQKKETEKSKAARAYVPLKRHRGHKSFAGELFPDPIPDYKRWDATWKEQQNEQEVEQLKEKLEKL